MGFWYFLILFVGIFLLVRALIKRATSSFKRGALFFLGICMIGFSLFMFQDGSAEIVDDFLEMLHIDL